jgi:hypothetical protein
MDPIIAALLIVVAPLPDTTILNTSIVSVDRARGTITVRVDAGTDSGVDRNRTRQLTVAPAAVAGLARLKAGSAVLLTLRGDTVTDIKMSSGGGGRSTPPTSRNVPQLPAGANSPQARPVPQLAPPGSVTPATPSPGISPVAVVPRPAVSPVSVASPRSPGTPRPVVLPSDPPPTPIPSPRPG